MYFVIAGVLGILLGLLVPYNLSSSTLPYVAVAIVAALDSVFGALYANLHKKFNFNVFMTGLVANAILAVLFTYMGDLLGISLYFVAIIVFGVRIFNNMAAIRRFTFDIYFEKRAREKARLDRLALRAAEAENVKNADDDEKADVEPESEEEPEKSSEEATADSVEDEKNEAKAEGDEEENVVSPEAQNDRVIDADETTEKGENEEETEK